MSNSDLAAVNDLQKPTTNALTTFEDPTMTLQELREKYTDSEIPRSFGYALIAANGQQVEPEEFYTFKGQRHNLLNKIGGTSPIRMTRVEKTDILGKILNISIAEKNK